MRVVPVGYRFFVVYRPRVFKMRVVRVGYRPLVLYRPGVFEMRVVPVGYRPLVLYRPGVFEMRVVRVGYRPVIGQCLTMWNYQLLAICNCKRLALADSKVIVIRERESIAAIRDLPTLF